MINQDQKRIAQNGLSFFIYITAYSKAMTAPPTGITRYIFFRKRDIKQTVTENSTDSITPAVYFIAAIHQIGDDITISLTLANENFAFGNV